MARSLLPIRGALAFAIMGYGAHALAVDCFIDNVNGNDGSTGLTEDQAVKTQAKIPSTCTVARYKRGSQFNEKVNITSKVTTYTNYGNSCDPLPKFVMPGTKNTGAVVSATSGGITIDGLALANSHGDGSSSSFSTGVCVSLGSNSIMQNCDITSCDIGVMMGANSKFLNNYVHDLNTMIVDASIDSGANINSVGGAEGIFVSGSNSEVAYNQFINCTTVAAWTGGNCDGGATEVSIGGSGTVSGLKIHHNFAYNTCGFFEVSSGGQGTFADSEFYDNVSVDSGWMFLLQVNNTTLSNVRWENNTIIYHKSSGTTYAPTPSMIYNGTGTTGGAATGTVAPNTVFFNNNLVLYDGFSSPGSVDKNISQSNNLITSTTAGVVKNLGASSVTPSPSDFDLVAGSPAIDQGMVVTNTIMSITSDFLNRTVPAGGAPDIGAFEYDSSTASGQTPPVSTMDIVLKKVTNDCTTTGGAGSTGGSPSVTGGASSAGGSSAKVTGGSPSTGGSGPKTTGGSKAVATGGAPSTGGSSVVAGGANGTGGANNPVGTGGVPASTGGASPITPGGGAQATGGIASTNVAQGGADNAAGAGNVGGAAVAATTTPVNTNAAVDQGACTCRVAGRTSQSTAAAGWFALLMLGWGIRRNRRSSRA